MNCLGVVRASGLVVLALAFWTSAEARGNQDPPADFSLRSSAFEQHGEIPTRYTCEGEDVSPPLEWANPPAGTRSFALIMDDPDAPDPAAPKVTWVHWILYDLPAEARSLPRGAGEDSLPQGARAGRNGWGRPTYGGPCPPIGRHRYFFKLYALDRPLAELPTPSKLELEKAMRGHVLGRGELVGTYQKKKGR